MGEPSSHPPGARLYPRTPPKLVVIGAISVVVALALVILNLGGPNEAGESGGDLVYHKGTASRPPGRGPQLPASIADLLSADIEVGDSESLFFTAQVASSAPRSLKSAALEFRWDLHGDDGSVWTLIVSIDRDAQVALFSDGGYGSGTTDGTLPGAVVIEDDTVSVRLERSEIDDFPSAFDWNLATTLRAFRNQTDSPRVEDRFPDEGEEHFEA